MFKQSMSFGVLMLVLVSASAFEIKPEFDRNRVKFGLQPVYTRWLANLSEDSHEEITLMSLACAENKHAFAWCDLQKTDSAVTIDINAEALKAGARWNDDPNNFFPSGRPDIWFFWMKKASIQPGKINFVYPLEYRSHYGDLQFLHAMGRHMDGPNYTQRQIVDWAHFSYDIATGRIPLSAQLSVLANSYPFAGHFSGTTQRSWTVRKLFTNVGDILCRQDCELQMPDGAVRALALGALLHTVQDSFSHSHAERSNSGITAWLDYTKQNSNCHGHADKDIVWIRDEKLASKPATRWGAWLIRNAAANMPWEKGVGETISTELFRLNEKSRRSDAGGFTLGGPACPIQQTKGDT